MKLNLSNIITGFCLLTIAPACDSFLEVHPKGEVLDDEMFSTAKGYENALYGVYGSMRSNDLYGRNLTYYTLDVMAQYFNFTSQDDYVTPLRQFQYKKTAVKAGFLTIWSQMYTAISNVNNVLKHLDNTSADQLKYYDIYKGEALGLRAFLHFDLARLFCEQNMDPQTAGIPYNTQFSLEEPRHRKLQEVYQCIVNDLREAEKLLDNPELYASNPSYAFLKDRKIHFNLNAVRATLARVYLTQENTDSALYYARTVIASPDHHLTQRTKIAFNGQLSPGETIFGLYSKTLYTTTLNELYKLISYQSLALRTDIKNRYTDIPGNDYRWSAWFKTDGEGPCLKKLTDDYQLNTNLVRPDSLIAGINLIRLPEMYYIVAECLLKKNDPEATGYFRTVLNSRMELSAYPELNITNLTEERFKEFIGEGQQFYHLKRLNLDMLSTTGENIPASKAIFTPDIPEEEFNYRN